MTDLEKFLAVIRDTPYDQNLRRQFSDWLEENGYDDEAAWQRAWTPEWQRANDYLRGYAIRFNTHDTPDVAFANLLTGLKTGDLLAHGTDLHGLYELDDQDELKAQAEVYLKIEIDWSQFSFSCSC